MIRMTSIAVALVALIFAASASAHTGFYQGNSLDNTAYGHEHEDDMYGNDGRDTLNGLASWDDIFGGDHADNLYGSYGGDWIRGGSGWDYLNGGPDGDILNGSTGNDELFGGLGIDDLFGGYDSDTLDAGGGTGGDEAVDRLDCGPGEDWVYLAANEDILVAGHQCEHLIWL